MPMAKVYSVYEDAETKRSAIQICGIRLSGGFIFRKDEL